MASNSKSSDRSHNLASAIQYTVMPNTTFTVSSVVEDICFSPQWKNGQSRMSNIMEDEVNTEAKLVKKNTTLVEPCYLKTM
jgi:hypothetical protein